MGEFLFVLVLGAVFLAIALHAYRQPGDGYGPVVAGEPLFDRTRSVILGGGFGVFAVAVAVWRMVGLVD